MDQTTLIVVFLAFVSLNAVLNAALLFAAHKAFGKVTANVTTKIQDFQKRREPREWLQAMMTASAQAVSATETAKRRMSELEPALRNMHARYDGLLITLDNKLERVTADISDAATRLQDASRQPAEKLTVWGEKIRAFLRRYGPVRKL
jgi:hypothetical protein